jgi:iron complex transport system permease protein
VSVATERLEAAPRVEARGVSFRAGLTTAVFLVASLVVGLAVGPTHFGFGVNHEILWQLRAPEVVLAALVGGMLAIAGASYQGVFRNPLCDPYLLGVAGGAGLGATLAIVYASTAGTTWAVPLAAFAGAITAVIVTYALGRSVGATYATGALVLAGVTMATFTAAVQTFIQQRHPDQLQNIYSWLLGGFNGATWHDVEICAPYIAVGSVVVFLHRRVLDVLSVGDDEAASLGINVARARLTIVVAATLGTAAAVSVSGLIAFVGIIVPHMIRLLVSTSYRAVIPLSLFAGAGFLVLADVLARMVVSPGVEPIGVITAFLGAPFFAFVLRRSRSMQ